MPNLETYAGKSVRDYDPNEPFEPAKYAYRVHWDWDSEQPAQELWSQMLAQENISELTALIIGSWDEDPEDCLISSYEHVLAALPQLSNLTHLFYGDIGYEESEISWIMSQDLAPLIHGLPNLTAFACRGGEDLRFRKLSHDKLTSLHIETGGMNGATIEDIIGATLPSLTSLTLWLGVEDYGFDGDIDTLRPLMYGRKYPETGYMFPKLTTLGLMNSEIADEIAEALTGAPVLEQIKTLDLSMGTMTERGARALVDNPQISTLKNLNLSNNHIQDTDLFDQLASTGVSVTSTGQKTADGDYYYVDVSE